MTIPERFLTQRNRLFSFVGTSLLSISGWKVSGQIPDMKKLLVVLAPHTSNWDFVYGMALILSLKIKIYWLGKHSIFKKGVTRLLKSLGGIPVNREDAKNTINDVLEIAKREGVFLLGYLQKAQEKG